MRRFGRLVGRVCNVVNITGIFLISEQDDEALSNMWASATLYLPPPDRIPSKEEKNMRVQMLLSMGKGRAGAIEYLKFVRRGIHRDAPHMGVRPSHLSTFLIFLILTILGHRIVVSMPQDGVLCKTVEFDNIKVFYHPMRPYPQTGEGWNFCIARPGASPRECIVGSQKSLTFKPVVWTANGENASC